MCSEDEELTSNYIIAQGAVDYIVRNHDGVEMPQLCKRFTKGDVFGESALVNQRVRTGSIRVQVSRDSTGGADVLVYSREDLARAKAARKSQEILALFRQKQERCLLSSPRTPLVLTPVEVGGAGEEGDGLPRRPRRGGRLLLPAVE